MNSEEIRIQAVSGVCSWCGKFPAGGCEVGCIANEVAFAFCDSDCYGQWNLMHGIGPLGEVLSDDGLGGTRW